MSNETVVISNLVVEDFKNVVCKSVNIREREGKKPLVFIELMDFDTFNTTGEMLLLNNDLALDQVMALKQLERKKVKATLRVSPYNGRTSLNITNMIGL